MELPSYSPATDFACTIAAMMADQRGFGVPRRIRRAWTPVDASGAFVDGTSTNGVVELRQVLLQYPEAFRTRVAEQLLIYSSTGSVAPSSGTPETLRTTRHMAIRFDGCRRISSPIPSQGRFSATIVNPGINWRTTGDRANRWNFGPHGLDGCVLVSEAAPGSVCPRN